MTNHGLIEVIAQRLQATFPKTGPGERLAFRGVIELLVEAVGDWGIWKMGDLGPTATRRLAVLFLWLCVLASLAAVVAVVMLLTT